MWYLIEFYIGGYKIITKGEVFMKKQVSEAAADFLFYYLLGVTVKDIEEKDEKNIVNKCAARAYLDMSRTLKFSETSEADVKKEIERKRKDFCEEVCKVITDEVLGMLKELSEIPSDKLAEVFDEQHTEVCRCVIKNADNFSGYKKKYILEKIENKYKAEDEEDQCFYYGQAQKWVNMTIKYMWITRKWDTQFENLLPFLHVPVDSYIIEAVWNHKGWEDVLKAVIIKDKTGKYSSEKVIPWSRWNQCQYTYFQKKLREKLTNEKPNPIEWEGQAWIEIAKARASES